VLCCWRLGPMYGSDDRRRGVYRHCTAYVAGLGRLLSTIMGGDSIAWLRPLVPFTIFTAMVPLIGVDLGWAISASKWRSLQQMV
jgi:hypothetical protein